MITKTPFFGSIVALVTPMNCDKSIDYAMLQQLVRWHIQAGTDGLVVLGTTAETPTLSQKERVKILDCVLTENNGQLPIIVGAGSNATTEAVSQTQFYQQFDIAATMHVVPYYNKPTQDGLLAHYTEIDKVATKPIVLYDVPSRTNCEIAIDVLKALKICEHIVAIKDASGNLEKAKAIQANCPHLTLLSGDDPTSFQLMQQFNAKGSINVVGNIIPNLYKKYCDLAMGSNAKVNTNLIATIIAQINSPTNPIAVKFALSLIKPSFCNVLRLPMVALTDPSQQQAIAEVLKSNGIIV